MSEFENGYKSYAKSAGVNIAAFGGREYVGNIESAIDDLQKAINNLSKDGKGIDTLKGVAAEHWHAHTHNIDAAVKGVSARTEVLESRVVGSVDVKGNWEDSDYGLKFYENGNAAGKAQSEIYRAKYEAFRKGQVEKGHPPVSYEDYFQQEYEKYLAECARKNRTPQSIDEVFPGYKDPNNPLYMGQHRLIAKDQLEEARTWLTRRILEESNGGRPDQAKRYQETLDKLTDRVKSNDGSESVPISKEEAEELAKLAKEEGFDPADWGLKTEELINWNDIMRQANQAGLSAAVISVVLEVAPELYKREQGLSILIGAVDNNKSRRLCHEIFTKSDDLIYLDSGNGEFTGQVVCGIRRSGQTYYKPIGDVYPDVLEDTDKFPTELSCAEAAVSAPQSIVANIMAATAVVSYL